MGDEEEYDDEEDDEEDDDDAFSGSYGSSSYTPSTFTQNGDLIQMNDKEGDYSATNILNKNSITSMKSKQSSLMKYLKIELLPWLKIGHEESFVWFERAASPPFEDPKAMFLLGQCYWRGEGVKISTETALDWWRKADLLGDRNAAITLIDVRRVLSLIVMNSSSERQLPVIKRAWARLSNKEFDSEKERRRRQAFRWLAVTQTALHEDINQTKRGVGPLAKIVCENRHIAFLDILKIVYFVKRNNAYNVLVRTAIKAQMGFSYVTLNGKFGSQRKEAIFYLSNIYDSLIRSHKKNILNAKNELQMILARTEIKRSKTRALAKLAMAKTYYWFNQGHYLYEQQNHTKNQNLNQSLSQNSIPLSVPKDTMKMNQNSKDYTTLLLKGSSCKQKMHINYRQEIITKERVESELYEEQCYFSGNIGIATKMRYVLRKQWNCQYQLKKWAHERMAIEALLFFKQTSLYADFGVVPDAVNGEAKKNRINAMVYLQHRVQLLKQNNGDHKQNINYMNSSQEKTFNHIEHQSASKHDLLVRIKIAYKRRGLLELVVKHTNQLNNIKSKLKVDDNQYIKNYKKYNKVLLKQNKLLKNKNNNNNNNNDDDGGSSNALIMISEPQPTIDDNPSTSSMSSPSSPS
mmetsp:Transcript_9164/g.11011  ORF Transcript_9164/g.11011 Transcript_9164/m.11011 type:complete len:633 (-) Transcript_9164:121-2019(-)